MQEDAQKSVVNRSLLLVHGRDFKPAEEALFDISVSAIRSGIERDYPDHVDAYDALRKDMAYYGDLTNTFLESIGRHYDEQLDLGDRKNALTALRAIPARKRFGIRQYDRLPGKSAMREFLADLAAPLLGALGMTRWLINRVSRDFCEYLCDGDNYAAAIRQRVREKLCECLDRGDELLLVSHGMGCVVVYEVLWELSHLPEYQDRYASAKIDAWVTLGAPLGDNFIRKHLLGAGKEALAPFPTNVINWFNVSAEDDYSCHDNTLADDFKPMMAKRMVSAVHDYRIYNLAVRYGKSNPHSSIGYYIHPRVAKIIVDWLQFEPAGREATGS
jgi:hypothetical protein